MADGGRYGHNRGSALARWLKRMAVEIAIAFSLYFAGRAVAVHFGVSDVFMAGWICGALYMTLAGESAVWRANRG